MTSPVIAVVIPAWNEELRIGATLERVVGYLEARREPFELVVADDGSVDGTVSVVESFAERGARVVSLGRNRGKGAAVRAGVAETSAARVLITDADLSAPIEELPKLEAALAAAELAIGSRDLPGSDIVVRQPWHRTLAGRAFRALVRALALRGFHDTQCGFKLGRGAEMRSLCAELTVERFAWDVELIWLAVRRKMRVAEVGVVWRDDPESRVHLLRDSARMLVDVLSFRWRHRDAGRGGGE
ncbi:MAG TPA: dolichyl-phosphate beta-glucosyltransferase [Thermoanaerobaculia bacterium]|nr:dolichyl-phosphate beta-glucosyltransferase [Thermoanaerobaculia bacterium]